MAQNVELEIEVIRRFIEKTKQDRYLQFIKTAKNRRKFLNTLAHSDSFNWDLFKEVTKNEMQVILEALNKNKIPMGECYIISENSKLDTKTMDPIQAISETVGRGMGTILVFGKADIIFYESEESKSRYISTFTN